MDPSALPAAVPSGPSDLAAWNRRLNRTHAMAGMRARAGRIVRAIEARRRRLVADRILKGPHARVLDVGCEDGWMAEAYAEQVDDLVLLDVDEAVLARARARLPRAATVAADATDDAALGRALGRAAFDVVVVSALLEHLPEPDAALRALAPRLGDGGRFVVFVPADRPILLLKRVLAAARLGGLVRGLSLEPAPGHLRVFDRRRLVRLLGRQGRVDEVAFDPAVLGYVGVVTPRPAPGR